MKKILSPKIWMPRHLTRLQQRPLEIKKALFSQLERKHESEFVFVNSILLKFSESLLKGFFS